METEYGQWRVFVLFCVVCFFFLGGGGQSRWPILKLRKLTGKTAKIDIEHNKVVSERAEQTSEF